MDKQKLFVQSTEKGRSEIFRGKLKFASVPGTALTLDGLGGQRTNSKFTKWWISRIFFIKGGEPLDCEINYFQNTILFCIFKIFLKSIYKSIFKIVLKLFCFLFSKYF